MIEKMKKEEFEDVYDLILKNFPVNEVREYTNQKKLLEDDKFQIFVSKDEKVGKLKGFISVWYVEDYAFIDHFVVSSKYRNGGIGSEILKEIKEVLNSEIFLEVDLPETEIAKRRINFYKRNGYFLTDFKYQLPPLNPCDEPVTFMIMCSDEKITVEKFVSLKNELFKIAYGYMGNNE